MGQVIQVGAVVVGDILMLEGDRSITGQDGATYAAGEEADGDERFPGRLAAVLFGGDEAVDHVFVASNQVVVRRRGGWSDEARDRAVDALSGFLIFYG